MMHRLALLAGGVLAALVLAAPAASAAVGEYSVWSCRGPDGAAIGTGAWVPFGNIANAASRTDTCAADGALGVHMIGPADYAGGSVTGYSFTAAPGTRIVGYRVEMAGKTSSPTGGTHFELGLQLDGDPLIQDGDGCNEDLDPCTFGDLTAWDASENVYTRTGLDAAQLGFAATCTAPSSCVVGSSSAPYPAHGQLYRSEVVVRDPAAPQIGAITGSIVDPAATVSGRRSVRADVTDVGSGIARVQLLADGDVIDEATGRGRCAEPFTGVAPCPDGQNAVFELDTTTLDDGPHEIALRASDAAGNAVTSDAVLVTVDNRPAPPVVVTGPGPATTVEVPAPTPVPAPVESPSAQPQAPNPVSVTLRTATGRATLPLAGTLRGTATGADGRPMGGIALSFERRPLGGDEDEWTPAGAATTAADGSFRFPVVRQSGQLRVQPTAATVGGRALLVSFVAPQELSLSASDDTMGNGDRVTLRGRVTGDGGAQEGREVLVQAVVRGSWRTIDTAEIGDAGRITWRYRFENTTRDALYRFRIVLPKMKGLPWGRETSDPVEVLVRAG